MMDVSKMSMTERLTTILAYWFWFFMNPALVMWGWEALAWEFNLPQFSYWAVFCICHGAQWILSFIFRSRK